MHSSFPTRLLAWFLMLSVLTSCGGDEPEPPSPVTPVTPVDPDPPAPPQDTKAPTITVSQNSVNVIAGPSVTVSGEELKIGDVSIASWKDDVSSSCTAVLTLTPKDGSVKTINSWDKLSEEGQLQLKVADEAGNSSTGDIALTATAVFGLENLAGLLLQVDQEADLMNGLTIADGLTLQKVEVVQDGARTQVDNPNAYIPEYPGSIDIILTLTRPDGSMIEVEGNDLTVKGLEYHPVSLIDIKPVDVFPQIDQIEAGDPNIYSYVEDLRVAEAYVMREMMTEYGVGNYSPEEYQQLLSRVTLGLIGEIPDNYRDYEWIGPTPTSVNITDHGRGTFQNLTNLKGDYTSIKNLTNLGEGWGKNLSDYAKAHPNDIFMFSSSTTETAYSQSEYKENVFNQDVIDLCDLPNVIIFVAWGDIVTVNRVDLKIIYNGVYDEDKWDWRYLRSSMANSDQNNFPNSNMRVVIWTDSKWNVDITNSRGSLYPFGFNIIAIVSGRPVLPIYNNWTLYGEDLPKNGSYYTSYTTPTIASEVQMMFGLHADVKDADELLQMIESATAAPDYISLNGQRQALQKYSPANFVKKYCMTTTIPSSISLGETIPLTKEWYKGLVFDIPGAEVLIDGQWIAYDAKNKDLILSHNLMNLEWRLNGDLLRKMGYTSGQTVQGQVVTVDDQWNGLRMEVPFSVQVR